MEDQDLYKSLKQYDILTLVFAIFLLSILTFLYFYFDGWGENSFGIFAKGLIINLIPVLITFLIFYFLFRNVQALKTKAENNVQAKLIASSIETKLDSLTNNNPSIETGLELVDFIKTDWNLLLRNCIRLDILVHYFNTWIRNNRELIIEIFNKGGTIRLLLPNPENPHVVEMITKRFPEYIENDIRDRINGTITQFRKILSDSHNKKGKLEIYIVDEVGFYSGIRINNQILVLSEYEHIRVKSRIESPGFIIDLKKFNNVDQWFEKEITGLVERSIKKEII